MHIFNIYGQEMTTNKLESNMAATDFPVPFSIEQLREDILFIFFQQVRTIALMTDNEKTAWNIFGRDPDDNYHICDVNITPADVSLSYSLIESTPFAKSIETMYQYAYYGVLDTSDEEMSSESTYTWTSAILETLNTSAEIEEWESYGCSTRSAIKHCYEVAELANARSMLEGNEHFFYFRYNTKSGDPVGFDNLSIRQMSLLSGMEEMSIRAAANPKRANPLRTYSDEGNTRVSLDDAKAWLISKNRYVPITKKYGNGEIDLSNRKFSSIYDLAWTLSTRFTMLDMQNPDKDLLEALTKNKIILFSGTSKDGKKLIEIDPIVFKDSAKVQVLASILNLNSTLLNLRAREALAIEEMAKIEYELRQIVS